MVEKRRGIRRAVNQRVVNLQPDAAMVMGFGREVFGLGRNFEKFLATLVFQVFGK